MSAWLVRLVITELQCTEWRMRNLLKLTFSMLFSSTIDLLFLLEMQKGKTKENTIVLTNHLHTGTVGKVHNTVRIP